MASQPYDAREVANFLLDLADEQNVDLSQVSLLKILYFCHGWYLLVNDIKLIKNDFEAWEYGPVVRVVRDEFKKFGSRKIQERARKLNIYTGERVIADSNLAESDKRFVKSVFVTYYNYSAWKLSDLTHEPGSPWDKLWNSKEPVARLGLRIRDEEIKRHFELIAARNRVS